MSYEDNVYHAIEKRKHLRPLFTNTNDIPQRIREYDPNMFVVYNTQTGFYEVHSMAHIFDTFATQIPFKVLDIRALWWLKMHSLKDKSIYEYASEIDEKNEKLKRQKAKQARNNTIDYIADHKSMIAKAAWQ
jgi:hypothetical protein